MAYDEPRLPSDATQIGRFRRVLGEAGVDQLLKSTIEACVSSLCFMALILYRVMRQRLKLAGSELSPETALAKLRRIQPTP